MSGLRGAAGGLRGAAGDVPDAAGTVPDATDAEAPATDSDGGFRLSEAAPSGPVVGIETSSGLGSVALAVRGAVVGRRMLPEPSRHSVGLIPAIEEVLGDEGLGPGDLVGIAVGAGPGSFTGVKVAAAAAKGLACSLEVPLYATSSLRAAAVAGARPPPDHEGEIRYVLFDAKSGRVYGGCYDVGAAGAEEAIAPHGGTILDVIDRRPPRGTVFMGDGAVCHAALIRAAGYAVRPAPAGVPTAGAVLRCCDWVAVDAANWEPDYVREWRPG